MYLRTAFLMFLFFFPRGRVRHFRSKQGGGFRALPLAVVLSTIVAVPVWRPHEARGQIVCNGFTAINYCDPVAGCPTPPPDFALVGDAVRVSIAIGAGSITGGALNQLTINRLRFELDCDVAFALGIPCTDDGAVARYDGDATITSNCAGVAWSTGHAVSDAPNEVVLTPSAPIVIPANTFPFCSVEFNVTILSRSTDTTPDKIEEVAGYSVLNNDATCDNGLASSGSQSAAIILCPQCPAPGECEKEGICSRETGECTFPPKESSTPCTDTDGNLCTTAGCNGAGVCVQTHVFAPNSTPCKDTDKNACTTAGCNGLGVCDQRHIVKKCPTGECDAGCNPQTGQCTFKPDSTPCADIDGKACTTAGCNGLGVCDQMHIDECVATVGCRITVGGIIPGVAICGSARNSIFGGEVGASCGCIGCFDQFDHIQGEWVHQVERLPAELLQRRTLSTRREILSREGRLFGIREHNPSGNFHAMDYNSLVCGCDGVFDGNLCNPGNRGPGPEPRSAPANMACFSGIGKFSQSSGRRAELVAFRAEVEDRGEPAAGKNAALEDVYRLRIWIPTGSETAKGLAEAVCCTVPLPEVRPPNIDDGGTLLDGNIQIQPQTPLSGDGICPRPETSCPQ